MVRAETRGQTLRERGEKDMERQKRERGWVGRRYEPAAAPAEGGGGPGIVRREQARSP